MGGFRYNKIKFQIPSPTNESKGPEPISGQSSHALALQKPKRYLNQYPPWIFSLQATSFDTIYFAGYLDHFVRLGNSVWTFVASCIASLISPIVLRLGLYAGDAQAISADDDYARPNTIHAGLGYSRFPEPDEAQPGTQKLKEYVTAKSVNAAGYVNADVPIIKYSLLSSVFTPFHGNRGRAVEFESARESLVLSSPQVLVALWHEFPGEPKWLAPDTLVLEYCGEMSTRWRVGRIHKPFLDVDAIVERACSNQARVVRCCGWSVFWSAPTGT
ncbi:hypothetical protein DFH08DRAFT_818672 [Mycena albidolilacea]|uniref:Uncharacterized protein n=1 Tax=Mycena albidolilacea TaxID=1033008 RepID=A0AAD6ZGD6_9AGAR|nr:hypothetical protein DFH08DRAFT_818672 [Mycena albidolilacea]